MTRLSLILAVAPLIPPAISQNLSNLYEKTHAAVVSIEVVASSIEGGREEGRYGSGFFISKDGIIITNYHVIRDATSIVVKNEKGYSWISVWIGPYDEQKDLATLRVTGDIPSFLIVPRNPTVKVGQRVVAIGNPKGLESTFSEGIVSGVRKLSDEFGEVIQTTAPISPGSSGGPLLTLQGQAIGVTTFQYVGGQNLNFAVPVGSFVSRLTNAKWLTIPEWKKEFVRLEVDRTLARANSEANSGHNDFAKNLLKEALRLDDSHEGVLLALARLLVNEWDNIGANRLLAKYLSIDSSNAEAFEMQGIVLDKLGHQDRALHSYEKALLLNNRLPRSRYELILLLSLRGDDYNAHLHLDRLKLIDQQYYERARTALDSRR